MFEGLFTGEGVRARAAELGLLRGVEGAGDEILVRPGEYRESLVIDKAVTIRGDGPRDQIVVGPWNADEPCISIVSGAPTVTGLTITLQDITRRKRDAEALRDARATADQRQAFLHAVADRLPRVLR